MGSTAESESESIPKLPLIFSMSPHEHEHEPSGMRTPPLHPLASVPFHWEEQPGKPHPCTTDLIITASSPYTKCLDLPPRLITKTSSPTTVLDGPGGKSVFSSASFRSFTYKERRRRGKMQGSFDSNCSGGWSPTDDDNCQFGSFSSHKPKGSIVISSSTSDQKKMRRNSSISKLTRSHFWATIYEGFKQAVPWWKKTKKESFTL